MHEDGMVWQSSLIATVLGLIAPYFGLFAAMPLWAIQALVALTTAPLILVINHHVKRWLNKRWPDRHKRRSGDTGE